MKTEEENFDDLLKRKLGDEQFSFKEKYWDKARTLLDENRPRRKRFGFMFFMPMFFAVAIAAVILNNKNNEPAASALPLSAAVLNAPAENENEGQQLTTTGFHEHKEALIENTNLPELPPVASSLVAVNLAANNSNARALQHNEQESVSMSRHNQTGPAGEVAAADKMNNMQQHDDAPGEAVTGDYDVVANPAIAALLVQAVWKTELDIKGFQPSAVAYTGRGPRKNHSYKMLEAGINYYNPGSETWSPLNVHLGFKYCLALTPRLSLASGLSYSRLHQDKGKRTYDKVSYGFGENRETMGINTIRLDYLEVPLNVLYSFKGRYGLIGGASFNYLVQSADLVKKQNSMAYNEKGNGYFAAFNRFDVQLLGGFTYTLNRNFMLSATCHYGVTDVTKNAVFKSPAFNNNKGVRLTLGYQLF